MKLKNEKLPGLWTHHAYINGENTYTDPEEMVYIRLGAEGGLRIVTTLGHPSPFSVLLDSDLDSEDEAIQRAIDWMENHPASSVSGLAV